MLDPHTTLTAAASVQIAGRALKSVEVEVSGPLGVFRVPVTGGRFTSTVPLATNTKNRIYFTGIGLNQSHSAATSTDVTRDNEPPEVFIDSPLDGEEIGETQVTVVGRVGDLLSGFEGLAVTVNGLVAAVDVGIGSNGTFFRQGVPLSPGQPTTISVVATDSLSNMATTQIEVEQVVTPAPRIELVSGDGQAAEIGTLVQNPIVVRVVQADQSPFAGKLVSFRVLRSDGNLSDAGMAPEGQMLQVRTDAQGLAQAVWRLGGDTGMGNNRVEATSQSINGKVLFCASGTLPPLGASQVNVSSGHNQVAERSAPAPEPLRVWASEGRNPVPGVLMTFTVTRGGGKVNGLNEVTVLTDLSGHAEVAFKLGPDAGNNRVAATFPGNQGQAATFVIFGVQRGLAAAPTELRGLVLDNSNRAIGGALCELTLGAATQQVITDSLGMFLFSAVGNSGPGHLHVDGSTATEVGGVAIGQINPPIGFPSLGIPILLIPNAQNELPLPVRLPPINQNNLVLFDNTANVTLTADGIDGLRMMVRAGSVQVPDGLGGFVVPDPQNPIFLSLSQVHVEDLPMPLPDGAAPAFAWTLQPSGALFDPPVEITMPNMSGLAPGSTMYFLSFNHDTNRFEIVSTGRVAEDGSCMVSDPGDGISIAGWGGNCPPYPMTGNVEGCPDAADPCVDEGMLEGGAVSADAEFACVDEPLTFTASGVTDTGGMKNIECEGGTQTVPIAPEEIQYMYEIKKDGASFDPGTGSGGEGVPVAFTPADPGVYTVEFTATTDRQCPPEDLVMQTTPEDTATTSVLRIDLDVDSDNTNNTADFAPQRDEAEDMLEDDAAKPGKFVCVNDDDDDGDGVKDFGEGFGGDANAAEDDFVRIVFELEAPIDPTQAKIRVSYTASDPAGSSVGGSPPVVTNAPGNLRVWTKNGGVTRNTAALDQGGDFVEPKEYTAGDFGLTDTQRTMDLWIEGIRPSSTAGGDRILFEVDPDGDETAAGYVCPDAVRVSILSVDADVDSDNTVGAPDFAADRNEQEDALEEAAGEPGKYLSVNANDDDNDLHADYGDGFDLDAATSNADDTNPTEDDFIRLFFEVPEPIDLSAATFRLLYDGSDPDAVTTGAPADPLALTLPANGRLRIWTKNGSTARDAAHPDQGGDYVAPYVEANPAEHFTYTATELGLSGANRVTELWLEGIAPNMAGDAERIRFEIDPDGPGAAEFLCGDEVRVTLVALEMISDDNTVIPPSGVDSRVLISLTITDRLTDAAASGTFPRATVTFDGPPTTDDRVFRVQLRGLPAGVSPLPAVDVETVRPNDMIRNMATYGTIEGLIGADAAYRIDEQLRLVTNDADDAVGAPREPTRLVRIDENQANDRIRAEVTVGATPCTAVVPVCRPPAEDQETAIRTADWNFITLAGASNTIAMAIQWMNDDWAQACIRFSSVNAGGNQATVSNALMIHGDAVGAGNLTVTINGNVIDVPVGNGDTAEQIAQAIAGAIGAVATLTGEEFPHIGDRLVIVNRGTVVQPTFDVPPASTAPGVAFTQPVLTYADVDVTVLEAAVLGLNYRDADDQTLDFFTTSSTMVDGVCGVTGFDATAPFVPGLVNTTVLVESSLPPSAADNTHLPGHEVGHALFNAGSAFHHADATNLFHAFLSPEPSVDASKRLTLMQGMDARVSSGPGSSGPELLHQN